MTTPRETEEERRKRLDAIFVESWNKDFPTRQIVAPDPQTATVPDETPEQLAATDHRNQAAREAEERHHPDAIWSQFLATIGRNNLRSFLGVRWAQYLVEEAGSSTPFAEYLARRTPRACIGQHSSCGADISRRLRAIVSLLRSDPRDDSSASNIAIRERFSDPETALIAALQPTLAGTAPAFRAPFVRGAREVFELYRTGESLLFLAERAGYMNE